MIETRVTKLLGIRYPIVQGAIGTVSESPKFVAAVCNAGCLGILAACHTGAEGVRDSIRKIRQLTDKPFGVNLLPVNSQYDEILEIMVEEGVPVFSHGRYNPLKSLESAKGAHVLGFPTVGAVKHAVRAERDGADAVIVTGTEAGGHTSYVGTMVLVPAAVRQVNIPVIAGGGIATPEQFAAALCLGAEGIDMGTRFMITKESPLHPNAKKRILELTEEDTYTTVHASGKHHRFMLNSLMRQRFVGLPEVKVEDRYWKFAPFAGRAMVDGDVENGLLACGECIGLIDDIPSIQELVERMMAGAEKILRGKGKLVS